jgi:hypothetical protein
VKIINIETKLEGMPLKELGIVNIGRKLESTGHNGFHLSLVMPKKYVKPAVDLNTYGLTKGTFRRYFMLMVRRPRGSGLHKAFWSQGWYPEDNGLAAVDPVYEKQVAQHLDGLPS